MKPVKFSINIAGTDVVLGYSHYRYKQDRKAGRRWRIFDTVSTSAQWLLSAIEGHPYRGVSDNLAYRRQLFFGNNGFARSMNLRWGDDDVFVAEIARPDNTRVELAPDSQVTVYYDNLARTHRVLKMRRDFTARLGRQAQRRLQAVMSVLWLMAHAAAIAAVALNATNAVVIVAAVVMTLAACFTPRHSSCRHRCSCSGAPWSTASTACAKFAPARVTTPPTSNPHRP